MKIEKIYFDLDGVLADFERGVRELCGMEPVAQGYDKDAEREDTMWRKIRETGHFYDMLEPMPGALEMFNKVYEKYGDRCEILSGIPKPKRMIDSAADDKTSWVRRLLSKDIKINLVYRREKAGFCTGGGCVLIDDYEKSIKEWKELGGVGILHKDSAGTLEVLKDIGAI